MKQLPKKVKVGGIVYKVVQMEMVGSDCGGIDLDTNEITINKDLMQDQKEVTLFHEVFHAINWKLNETEVEMYSQAVYAFLKDNDLLK